MSQQSTLRPALRSLRHVALFSSSYEESVEFYAGPWGLEIVPAPGEDGEQTTYLRASGPEHHVLELHRSETNGLHHVAFAAADREDVDRAYDWMVAEQVELLGEPGRLPGPGGGYGFRFLDLENRLLEISAEVHAVPPRVAAAVPTKVAHVVLNTVDIDAATAWYTRILGFRVSDWSEHQMVFLRTNSDHHVVAFNQAPHTAPNHTAYEVGDLDAFLRSIGRLKVAGHETAWGPGRHGPGDNAFAYYVDPSGLVPEVTAEVLQIDEETWMPRVWQRTPELSDLFRTAGPPSSHVRAHMAGVPDPGWAVSTIAGSHSPERRNP